MNRLSKYKYLDVYISIMASVITIIYAIIQVIHTHNTKNVIGISIYSVSLALLTNLLLLIHGCFVEDNLIFIISGTTLILNIYRIYQYCCFSI